MSHNSRSSVQLGVRQDDVVALASAILNDESMNLPMIPDSVERVIYESAIKLTFNLFYKGISGLDGMGLVSSASANGSRELHLDRNISVGQTSEEQQRQWTSFQSKLDLAPLENLASALLQNEAVNITVIPDSVEKQVYFNCLKIIFWILDLITSNLKVSFCGHTISMNFAPASGSYLGSRGGNNAVAGLVKKISSFMVNPQTVQDFQRQATALLAMDGNIPGGKQTGNRSDAVKTGLAWMKSSLNKMQQEMTQKLNVSLYGLILAVVDDLLQSTKIEILNDQISLRVATAGQVQGSNIRNDNNVRRSHLNGSGVDDITLAVEASLGSLDFSQERALLQRRFQEWSPEQRALILKDLNS